MVTLSGAANGLAEGVDVNFISRSSPAPAFIEPQPARFNLKFGKLNAHFKAGMQGELNDNINLSKSNKEADISMNPNLQVGLFTQISETQLFELNLGVGYRWYLNHPGVSTFGVDPRTRVDYRVTLFQDIEVRFYDAISIQSDPTTRADISGVSTALTDFRLLNNTAGALVNWQPLEDLRFSAGYSYSISRTLTDQFKTLNMDTHAVSAGTYYTISPRLTVGINASMSFMSYSTNFQNDATGYNVGPVMIYRPSEFISVSTFVGYSTTRFDNNGTINDKTQSSGLAANVSINHRFNRKFSHDLQLGQSRDLGVGSNFNETFTAQYGISTQVRNNANVHSSITYQSFQGSGPTGEEASRYLFYIGTGFKFSKHWSTSLGYTLSLKDSNFNDRDYTQNRITLDLNREF